MLCYSTPSITTGLGTALGALSTLNFSQLEDYINKWTIQLEDEGKHYSNEAKHINAWDHLLITNGEKVLSYVTLKHSFMKIMASISLKRHPRIFPDFHSYIL